MALIRACATGLRTKATSCNPARRISATNCPRPRIRRSSSLRGSRAPTPCPTSAEEGSRSLRTSTVSTPASKQNRRREASGRHRLRQDRGDGVVFDAGAQAERRLQQAIGNHFVVFVVAQHV